MNSAGDVTSPGHASGNTGVVSIERIARGIGSRVRGVWDVFVEGRGGWGEGGKRAMRSESDVFKKSLKCYDAERRDWIANVLREEIKCWSGSRDCLNRALASYSSQLVLVSFLSHFLSFFSNPIHFLFFPKPFSLSFKKISQISNLNLKYFFLARISFLNLIFYFYSFSRFLVSFFFKVNHQNLRCDSNDLTWSSVMRILKFLIMTFRKWITNSRFILC